MILSRRSALGGMAATCAGTSAGAWTARAGEPAFRLATFAADVTPPVGHPCMGGGVAPAREVLDPLSARGVILAGGGDDRPVVIAAVDWCEIRNDAYDRWREAIAEAAGTTRERVMLSSVHQHDAPVADLEAQRLLEAHGAAGAICDLAFHETAVRRVAGAVREAWKTSQPVTHVGMGRASVMDVASNRRTVDPDGTPRFDRMSATRDAALRARPAGLIDPVVRSLSFYDGDTPRASLFAYAVHPMSHYGGGGVSSDFVGRARAMAEDGEPGGFAVYLSGCSGNTVAGKHNDGDPANRPRLAARLHRAMADASRATRRVPLRTLAFRNVPFTLPLREEAAFGEASLLRRIQTDERPFGQCLAALGLSWRRRVEAGRTLDLPVLDLGAAVHALLPAEAYVEFQLAAQAMRPDAFVTVAGYGECGPGYIPTEQARREGDSNLGDWCWVGPGAAEALRVAMRSALVG
jgi:hypothetical protein